MVPRKPKRKSTKPRRRAPSGQSRRLGKLFAGAKPVAPGDLPWWDEATLSFEDLQEIGRSLEGLPELVHNLQGHLEGGVFKQPQNYFEQEGLGQAQLGDPSVQEGYVFSFLGSAHVG